jgi:hypothetical protein
MASVTVEVSDVAARYEGDLESEFRSDYISTQITDAVALADAHWGDAINSRLSSGALPATVYKRIIANAVLRVLRNPEGYTSENEGGYGNSRRVVVASGDLWFTEEEAAQLSGISAGGPGPGTVGIALDRGWA